MHGRVRPPRSCGSVLATRVLAWSRAAAGFRKRCRRRHVVVPFQNRVIPNCTWALVRREQRTRCLSGRLGGNRRLIRVSALLGGLDVFYYRCCTFADARSRFWSIQRTFDRAAFRTTCPLVFERHGTGHCSDESSAILLRICDARTFASRRLCRCRAARSGGGPGRPWRRWRNRILKSTGLYLLFSLSAPAGANHRQAGTSRAIASYGPRASNELETSTAREATRSLPYSSIISTWMNPQWILHAAGASKALEKGYRSSDHTANLAVERTPYARLERTPFCLRG